MSTENRVSSMESAKETTSNASEESPVAVPDPDPVQIFNKDVSSWDLNDQVLHIIEQNRCNFFMNGRLDKKVEDNTEILQTQGETIQVLKLNQQCISQQVMEIKNQFASTHTYIDNKIDEILKDTQESLREDRNVLLWQLDKKELSSFKKDSANEAEMIHKYAFSIVKEKLSYIEPIDLRAAIVPPRPGDKSEHFRMIIKFVSPGDANKFRVRLIADGTITARKGMSLMTRGLCTKYKELARRKNEAEPSDSNFEYRTKYQFSIVKHTKGNPDEIHGIAHSLNPSDPYSKLKLRPGMDLIPYPDENIPMETAGANVTNGTPAQVAQNVSIPLEQSGQDMGSVETTFLPPGEDPSNAIRESVATPVGRKRGRDEEEGNHEEISANSNKRYRDNSREVLPKDKPWFRPRGGFRSNFRGGMNEFGNSYRNGNSYRRNNGYSHVNRRGPFQNNGHFRGRQNGYQNSYQNGYQNGYHQGGYQQSRRGQGFDSGYDYDYDQDHFSANHIPIGQNRGNGRGRGRPKGPSKRGRGAQSNNVDANSNSNSGSSSSNVPSNTSTTSSSSKSSESILSQDQRDLAESVPVTFDSFDGKYISKFLQSHKKPQLAMKITQQQEELLKKAQELEKMERQNQELQNKLKLLETGPSGSSTSSSSVVASSVAANQA